MGNHHTNNIIHRYDLSGNMVTEHKVGRDVFRYYKVVRVLGEGSMGAVTCVKKIRGPRTKPGTKLPCPKPCRDKPGTDDDTEYAMKTIQLTRMNDTVFTDEFRNEINLLKSMDHPNIVKAFDVFERKRQIFLVMQFCAGGDLYDRLPYTEDQALQITRCLLSAIAYMHSKNIAHRDLKFENIMFESEDENAQIKLIDFGLSKKFGRDKSIKGFAGTIYSMAPEVFRGEYTEKVDLWSIGVITYMLLYNRRPFGGNRKQDRSKTIKEIQRGAYEYPSFDESSDAAKEFIESLIVVDPDCRSTAEEALDHEWFLMRHSRASQAPRESLFDDVQESLGAHKDQSAFKKMANMIIAHQLSLDEIYDLRKVFMKYDSSRDGQISFKEFVDVTCGRTGCTIEEAEEIFDGIVRHIVIMFFNDNVCLTLDFVLLKCDYVSDASTEYQ
mmetsp:Transcript_34529/g.42225  ORF Transcript_34529/g.42225 Transcript_34529/m.42225 type:complete len:440 (-) Transcript_34529:638-1957(-)